MTLENSSLSESSPNPENKPISEESKRKFLPLITKKGIIRLSILFFVLLILGMGGWYYMIWMPGKSYSGELLPLSEKEKNLSEELKNHVTELALKIGRRNLSYYPKALEKSLVYIENSFKELGYVPVRQGYDVMGQTAYNLEVEVVGQAKKEEIVVIGAHYDTVTETPGANDNGSGIAALLSLAKAFKGKQFSRTVRFVAFANEEPPYFQGHLMGSRVYAARCKAQKDRVVAMISLETLGYFSNEEGSQRYPAPFLGWVYPTKGNFIGFVGNFGSRKLVRKMVGLFRKKVKFPSQGTALPGWIPGVGWSDHWSFWQEGYPAVMVTDTAPFRYDYYHTPQDTPDKMDFESFARVVAGLEEVLEEVFN